MTARENLIALQALYDSLPSVDCIGKCSIGCGLIHVTPLESDRARLATGDPLPFRSLKVIQPEGWRYRCKQLTRDNRCGIYDLRPLICRLYGLSKRLQCQFGCKPTRYITRAEHARLWALNIKLGGLILNPET